MLTVAEVFELAGEMKDPRFRVLVLVATFASLRWGEAIALRRCDVDLDGATVSVRYQYVELSAGQLVLGPPKSRAGTRTVRIPATIVGELCEHMTAYTGSDSTALVFTGLLGGVLRRSNFRRRMWVPACEAVGLSGLRFHDLRHTGNTLAAVTGASTRELMARMGHSSPRAALVYQHATADRSAAIAKALSELVAGRGSEFGRVALLRVAAD